jgi:hypothetical protein
MINSIAEKAAGGDHFLRDHTYAFKHDDETTLRHNQVTITVRTTT